MNERSSSARRPEEVRARTKYREEDLFVKTYKEAGLGDVPRPIGIKEKPAPMPPLRLVTPPPLPRALDTRKPSEPIVEEVRLDPDDLEEADD